MRVTSVSEMKGVKGGLLRDLPREGSLGRQLYDALYANRGRPVDLKSLLIRPNKKGGNTYRRLNDLLDYWGCDIRSGTKPYHYILAGEWFGSHYSDYVVEAIDKAIKENPDAAV